MTIQLVTLFGVFFIAMFIQLPVFLAIALATVTFSLIFSEMSPVVLIQSLTRGLDNPAFTAIPYFFLLGSIMNAGGMSRRLLRLANALFGWCRGGLSQVNIATSILFGGISGSAVADASAIGSIMIPAMKKDGYPGSYAAAVTASSASIGLLIPPSIPMVMFGLFNNVSVADLFIAGLLPGLLMGLYLMIVSYAIARHRGYAKHKWQGWSEVRGAFKDCLWVLPLPVLIAVCLVTGIATVSEIGAVAAVYAACISTLVYRDTSFSTLFTTITESAIESAGILCIIAVAGGMLWIVASSGATREFAAYLIDLQLPATMLLAFVACGLVLIGTMVGPGIQLILIVPSITPVMVYSGIDVLHFGVVAVLASAISLVTPPVGMLLFLTASQAQSPISQVMLESIPFIVALLLLLVSVVLFPGISIWLVSLF